MIAILIQIVVVLIVLGLLVYLIDAIPLPDPFGRIAKLCIIVIGVLIIVLMLLSLTGVDVGLRTIR